MSLNQPLVIVGHKTETVRRAKALGLDVILLQHVSKLDLEQAQLADVTFVVDYRDWVAVRALIEAADQIWGIGAALSLTEPGLEIAARINDLLGLGGTSFEVCRRLRDKGAMRRHLEASGAATIGARMVQDRESLATFGRDYGYPFIVKPTDMTAGFGVLPVTEPSDLPRVWAEIRQLRKEGVTYGTTLFTIADFIMEEYVDGPEFSVEAFSFAGRHSVVAVTEKLVDPTYFVELGHTMPARIDPALEREIVGAVRRFLDVMGLTDGPSHTEVRVGRHQPVVIESHNRIGGDRIGDLVRAAYGIDLVEYALGWPFRLVGELPDRPQPQGAACVRFLHGRSGRVVEVGGIDRVNARSEVLAAELSVKVGDLLRPLRNNWDRLGLVAVRSTDSQAAVALCHDLIELLRVETVEEPPAAAAPIQLAGVNGR